MGELEVWRTAVDHEFTEIRARLDALEDESRALELRVLNQGMQLGDRLGALERRLAELEGTHGAVDTISLAMYTAGRERNDLAQRLLTLEQWAAELERQPAEWVRGGHGQRPDDAYNIDVKEKEG